MNSYTTVGKVAFSEFEDRKSRFLGAVSPVQTEEEALSFLANEKKKYPDAKHHVYAYILRNDSTMRYSDDHEPQGTAGTPILDMLRKKGLTDVCVVVSRYFGGTLLGTGGLVHAYSEAASQALDNAGIVTYETYTSLSVELSYSDYTKVNSSFDALKFRLENSDFSSSVILYGKIKSENYEDFCKKITDLTGGRAVFTKIDEIFSY